MDAVISGVGPVPGRGAGSNRGPRPHHRRAAPRRRSGRRLTLADIDSIATYPGANPPARLPGVGVPSCWDALRLDLGPSLRRRGRPAARVHSSARHGGGVQPGPPMLLLPHPSGRPPPRAVKGRSAVMPGSSAPACNLT